MVCQFAGGLFQPRFVGASRTPCEMDAAILELHGKEQIEGHQSVFGPDFNGRKNDCSQYVRGTVLVSRQIKTVPNVISETSPRTPSVFDWVQDRFHEP